MGSSSVVVQSLSYVSLQPHRLQHIRLPVFHYLPEIAQTDVHRVSDAIHPSHPLSPPSPHPFLLPSIFPSIRVFSNVSALHIRWTKYWSFSISPFNEFSGLISFRINWLDLLAVQGTLKSLLQCCNEHWGTRVSFPSGFFSVYAQQWDCWIIRQFYFQFFKESPHCSP